TVNSCWWNIPGPSRSGERFRRHYRKKSLADGRRSPAVRLAVAQPDGLRLAEPGNRNDVDVVVLVLGDRRYLLAGAELGDQPRGRFAVPDDQDDLALVLAHDALEHLLVLLGLRVVAADRDVECLRERAGGLHRAAIRRRIDHVDARHHVRLDELPPELGGPRPPRRR